MKKCKYCWEKIQNSAKKCRYCWERLISNVVSKKFTSSFPFKKISPKTIDLLKRLFRFSNVEKIGRLDFCLNLFIPMIALSLLYYIILWLFSLFMSDNISEFWDVIVYIINMPGRLYLLYIFLDRSLKRLHDLNISARRLLGFLIPWFNSLLFLALIFRPWSKWSNRYWPNPKWKFFPMKWEDEIIETILEKKELWTKIESDWNVVFFNKNAKVWDKCIIKWKWNKWINWGENWDLIYVISKIK